MKNGKYLPFLALFLGLVCAGARWTLFRNHTDALSLLETGTYAELCVWLLTGLCLVLFALGACSSTPPPREEMAVAKTTVDRVTTAPGTAAAAPVELQSARDKLARAERAMANKDYDEARRLADEAQADARLAEAKSQAARSEQAVQELQGSVRALNEELQRRAPRN